MELLAEECGVGVAEDIAEECHKERTVALQASMVERVPGVAMASYHETMAKSSSIQSEIPWARKPSM